MSADCKKYSINIDLDKSSESDSDTELITLVLSSFEKLIKKMRRRILPYMDDIVETMESQWTSKSSDVRRKLAELVYHSADVIQYEMKDNLTKIIQLMVQMFETLKNEDKETERKPLRQLVKVRVDFTLNSNKKKSGWN